MDVSLLITSAGGVAVGAYAETLKNAANLMGGNHVRAWAEQQYESVILKAKKKNDDKGVISEAPSPSIAIPLLNHAALETRESLADMWAELLAAAMDPARSNQVRKSFITVVEGMDPIDALVFNAMQKEPEVTELFDRNELARKLNKKTTEIDVSFHRLVELKCAYGAPGNMYSDGNYAGVLLTSLGEELKRALSGE